MTASRKTTGVGSVWDDSPMPLAEEEAIAVKAGLFDADQRLRSFSAAGDPLERLRAVMDLTSGTFDSGLFRAELEAGLPRADRIRAGRG